jgi:hypothetical protein
MHGLWPEYWMHPFPTTFQNRKAFFDNKKRQAYSVDRLDSLEEKRFH